MNLEQVAFDIEAIESCQQQIINPDISQLVKNYQANIEQILGSLAVPLLLMSHGLDSTRYFQYWIQGAIETKNVGKEKTEKGKEEIENFINTKFKNEREIHIDDAKKEIEKLRKKFPFFEQAIRNNALNTLVNAWTFFEATIKDLWIYCLNNFPKDLLFNVIKSKSGSGDLDGMSGKNVSIGLLAKYNFDVSENLGNILVGKFDFTTVRGINQSYTTLFNLPKTDTIIFENSDLDQLEITRHLIVHNAGTIDEDYLKRTKRKGEKIGERINLSTEQLSKYCNASILTAIKVFQLADRQINTANK